MKTTTELASVSAGQQIPMASMRMDDSSQSRVKIHNSVVREYAQAMKQQQSDGGLRFPAVVLFWDGRDYWLGDGFHRVQAAREAGLEEFLAEIHKGSRRDALLFAISANNTHGLPRTNADKRKAVSLLLSDPEWSQWSDREIARCCQVSNRFVSNLRKRASVNGSQMRERKARRGDNIYEMETAAIGTAAGLMPSDRMDEPNAPLSQSASVATDLLGIPLSGPMVDIFASVADFQAAKALSNQLSQLMDRIARGPGGEVYRQLLHRKSENGCQGLQCPDLDASVQKLFAAEPYCSCCPHCHLAHPGWSHPDCKTCRGRGWTTRAAFDTCPENYRQELLRQQLPPTS